VTCPVCMGKGRWVAPGETLMEFCWTCNGKGKVDRPVQDTKLDLVKRVNQLEEKLHITQRRLVKLSQDVLKLRKQMGDKDE